MFSFFFLEASGTPGFQSSWHPLSIRATASWCSALIHSKYSPYPWAPPPCSSCKCCPNKHSRTHFLMDLSTVTQWNHIWEKQQPPPISSNTADLGSMCVAATQKDLKIGHMFQACLQGYRCSLLTLLLLPFLSVKLGCSVPTTATTLPTTY